MFTIDENRKKVYNEKSYLNINLCVCRSEEVFLIFQRAFLALANRILAEPRVALRKERR